MTSQQSSEFQFNPSPTPSGFRELWKDELRKASDLLEELERPIRTDVNAINKIISLIAEFDFITTASFDVTGSWRRYTSDEMLLKEVQEGRSAFTALMAKAECSSSFAFNIDIVCCHADDLEDDTTRLISAWRDVLKRGGATLNPDQKAEVLRLSLALDDLETTFRQNLKNDNLRLLLTSDQLEGLPKEYLNEHMSKDHNGLFTVSRKEGDVKPILACCSVQATREKAFRHFHNTATDNAPVLEKILRLRQEAASLLGYQNWAELDMEETMLKTPETVASFLNDVQVVVDPLADQEMEVYRRLLARDGATEMQIWDLDYGQTLLRKSISPDFDPNQTTQYFRVAKVVPAIRQLVGKLFDLRFEEIVGLDTWDTRVTAYRVSEEAQEGKLLGRVFFDIFARNGKEDGAYTTTMRRPVINRQLGEAILCRSFSAAPDATMSHQEMLYTLHELGHCVPVLFAKQRYARFAGNADCLWKPQVLLELCLRDPRTLDFAVNKEGKKMPEDLLQRVLELEEIGKATRQREDLVYAQMAVRNLDLLSNAEYLHTDIFLAKTPFGTAGRKG